MRHFLISLIGISSLFSYAAFNKEEYQILDEIALRTKADKGSRYHNYTEIYSQYLYKLKNQPIKFLEIGIWRGYSVKLWEEYFLVADLHFIDVDFVEDVYFSPRSSYHLVDQQSPQDLARFIDETGGEFDVIIDDGGHSMKMQIVSFSELFPHVKSGGVYIIEDLHTSYWPDYGGGKGAASTVAFLKDLVDDLNYIGATTCKASHLQIPPSTLEQLTLYQKDIYSIHFYDSVAVIIKR